MKSNNMGLPDFAISAGKPVSDEFLKRNISDFNAAISFVRALPYARNADKNNLLSVFTDNCGTCSTKHAILKVLADENGYGEIKLILGLFKMNAANSPLVKNTLVKYKLDYIPEAHNYLRYNGQMIDCTKVIWDSAGIEKVVMEELEISPDQIAEYKVAYHKKFLEKWLDQNKAVEYDLNTLWNIREQCIRDLYN